MRPLSHGALDASTERSDARSLGAGLPLLGDRRESLVDGLRSPRAAQLLLGHYPYLDRLPARFVASVEERSTGVCRG